MAPPLIDLDRELSGEPEAANAGCRGYMLRMSVRFTSLVATGVLLSMAAGVAQAADPKGKPIDFTVRSESSAVSPGSSSVKWDARKGKWGLTLNLEQPDARPSTLNDVQAGAYYRITPSLRVGGAVALGEQEMVPGPKKISPDDGQPRVRLETAFKF
jgi:hypothetical protein